MITVGTCLGRAAVVSVGISLAAIREFSDELSKRLKAWGYPEADSVRYDRIEQDIQAGDQFRSSHGKGVRAILHAAFTLGLAQYCKETAPDLGKYWRTRGSRGPSSWQAASVRESPSPVARTRSVQVGVRRLENRVLSVLAGAGLVPHSYWPRTQPTDADELPTVTATRNPKGC
jgi:hypothetical protein